MTEKTNEVYEKVHTSCADCIFAEYDEKTQTGCSFDRVEKFRSSGCEVVDAEDNDKQFFVIGRFCNAYRKQAWKELVENTNECSHKELMQTAKDEMSLRCGVMILMNPESTMPEVEETIHAIFKQKNNEPEYIVVVNNSKESHSEVISRMHHVVQDRCVFYAVKIRGGVATTEQALDYGFHNIKNSYFICFEAGHTPPENFIDFLDYKLNEEMQQLLLSMPTKGSINGFFTQSAIYKFLYGNNTTIFFDKLKQILSDENLLNLCVDWEDLVHEITEYNNNNS
tara:strand:+ start:20591 stop:21436 length:846 start_codon:yes stop_codon:yes gene_type:complete